MKSELPGLVLGLELMLYELVSQSLWYVMLARTSAGLAQDSAFFSTSLSNRYGR